MTNIVTMLNNTPIVVKQTLHLPSEVERLLPWMLIGGVRPRSSIYRSIYLSVASRRI